MAVGNDVQQDLVFSVKLQLHICLGLQVLVSSSGRKQSRFLILAQKCNENLGFSLVEPADD